LERQDSPGWRRLSDENQENVWVQIDLKKPQADRSGQTQPAAALRVVKLSGFLRGDYKGVRWPAVSQGESILA
jgi:hypothetical protein